MAQAGYFTPELFRFLRELKVHNRRAWRQVASDSKGWPPTFRVWELESGEERRSFTES